MDPGLESLPMVRVYIDETGDRAFGEKCTPMFAVTAVMVAEEHDRELRAAVAALRTEFGIEGVPIRWSTHCGPSNHDRRRHVARTLAEVPSVQLVYAVIDKTNIPQGAALRTDRAIAYNYVARLLFERIALAARGWPDGPRRAQVHVAHVKGHDHPALLQYLQETCPAVGAHWVPWRLIGEVTVSSPAQIVGLEAADLYCGMFSAAVRPDKFGYTDHDHLLRVAHQLRRGPGGQLFGCGIKVLGGAGDLVTSQAWWPLVDPPSAA